MDMLSSLHSQQSTLHPVILQSLVEFESCMERDNLVLFPVDKESWRCVLSTSYMRHGANGGDTLWIWLARQDGWVRQDGVEPVEYQWQACTFFEGREDELGARVAGTDPAKAFRVNDIVVVACDLLSCKLPSPELREKT